MVIRFKTSEKKIEKVEIVMQKIELFARPEHFQFLPLSITVFRQWYKLKVSWPWLFAKLWKFPFK